jgi:esterase/lipase superfamily enzyme
VKAVARLRLLVIGLLFALAGPSLANSFQDDSHDVSLGPRTGYYVVRDGSRLSHQVGVDDAPYIDTSDPLRHGYGADVLAFRFNQAGRLIAAPAYIANAEVNEFYTRRIGSLVCGRTTVRDVQTLFGHAQAVSRRPDGFVYYYTLDVFNPFEQFGHGRR